MGPNEGMLSFKPGDKMTIISKAEEKDGYWVAQVSLHFYI